MSGLAGPETRIVPRRRTRWDQATRAPVECAVRRPARLSRVDAFDELLAAQFGKHGLAGDNGLPQQNFRIGPVRQVDVSPATEANQTDPLARGYDVARLD